MCGICGFVGSGSGETLERMSILLRHRGPDDSGTWMSAVPPVHLASRRLAVLVGFGKRHVDGAQQYHTGGRGEHSVNHIPGIVRSLRPRPENIDDGADAIGEGEQVYEPTSSAERKGAGRPPALGARNQRSQHDHLKADIDADGRETDDGGDGILHPQCREGDDGRNRAHHRGQAVAERPLGDNHQVEQHRRRVIVQQD